MPGGTRATTCPTVDGAALNWNAGAWVVQVVTLTGTDPSAAEAGLVEGYITTLGLPVVGGFISVVVPGSPSAGPSVTAAIEWAEAADAYDVRSLTTRRPLLT